VRSPALRGTNGAEGTIPPSGDSITGAANPQSARLASYVLEGDDMLEWKPRLMIVLVAVVAVAAQLGSFFESLHFSW
jgi:hypothetical protein